MIPSLPFKDSLKNSLKNSLKIPSLKNPLTNATTSDKPDKPVKPKKPMSSFMTGIIFAFIFVGIIVTLFTVYTLNSPDALNFISKIQPGDVLFIGFMIIVGFIGLSIVLGILCYLLFDILGSTMFFLLLHICLLLVCSPYFLIVLIWGTYKFLTTESLSSGSSSSSNDSNNILELGDITLSEKKSFFGKFNLFGKKTEEEKKKAAEEKAAKEKAVKEKAAEEKAAKEKAAKEKAAEAEKKKKAAEGKGNSWFSSKSLSKKEEPKKEPNNRNLFNIFGGGDEPSSLQKFMNILEQADRLGLWKLLLFIYVIQNWLLESTPSKIYNKLMHRS